MKLSLFRYDLKGINGPTLSERVATLSLCPARATTTANDQKWHAANKPSNGRDEKKK